MSLPLKYRPTVFRDIIGQEHVVIVLGRIIHKFLYSNGSLPPGLLLCGSKGTGKTTTARIVAACLNCLQEGRTTIEPCNVCLNCVSVRDSNCPFVMEVDAASTNSVESIRNIKDIANLHHSGNIRLIILDEAHSLTDAAFQALLKTLEEPPSHTLFVMATTEPESFPETILSRLMQFDYKRVPPQLVASRLAFICQQEGIQVADREVLLEIAKKAEGALRDSIKILEQLSYYKMPLSVNDFYDYFSLVNVDVLKKFIEYAKSADIAKGKALILELFSRALDINYLFDSFMHLINDLPQLTTQQALECYRAAIEVKSKLKYINSETAMYFLFKHLLQIFQAKIESGKAAIATIESLRSAF